MSPNPTRNTGLAASAVRLARAYARAADRTPPLGYVAAVVPVAFVIVVVATQPWVPPTDLIRDSQVVAVLRGSSSTLHGLVSNLGILAITVAAGAAFVGAAAAPRRVHRLRRALAWGGALSLAFALDDLLLLHETATFASWVPKLIAAAYAAAFGAYVWRFRAVVLRHLDVGLLTLAILAFGMSAIVDVLAEPATVASVLAEDGAKLLGLAAWAAFLIRGALTALRVSSSTDVAVASDRAPGLRG
ncbi:hypothetical protein [Agromyces arachidis]|uniref:hypothetical protein n=1 Tax=Agromyces arachidis TaxID=766966 RepID=UPI00405604D7